MVHPLTLCPRDTHYILSEQPTRIVIMKSNHYGINVQAAPGISFNMFTCGRIEIGTLVHQKRIEGEWKEHYRGHKKVSRYNKRVYFKFLRFRTVYSRTPNLLCAIWYQLVKKGAYTVLHI